MRLFLVLACAGCGFSVAASTDSGVPGDGADAPAIDAPPFSGTSPRKLVFANAASATNLVNFPVLVELTPSNIDYGMVPDPRVNLRFEGDGRTSLPYEVESWDPTGTSVLWVLVPQLDAGSNTDSILMHFGPSVTGLHDPDVVWAGYELVAHLGASLADATVNGYNGVASAASVTAGTGQVGGSARFAGGGPQRITFQGSSALLNTWAAFAFELWIRADYGALNEVTGEPGVINQDGTLINGRLIPQLRYQVDVTFDSGTEYLNTMLPFRQWTHVLYTFDGRYLRLYRNGQITGSADTGGGGHQLAASGGPLAIGGQNALKGDLDELRVSAVDRSADWIRAQYASMTRQLVTFTDP